MTNNNKIENWLLSLKEEDQYFASDYIGTSEKDYPKPIRPSWDNLVEVNQGRNPETSSSCTVAAALWAVCTNLWLSETEYQDLLPEVWKIAQNMGAKQPWGWSIPAGVDLVRAYVNLNKDLFRLSEHQTLVSERLSWWGEDWKDIMDMWYMFVGGYRGDWKYNDDRNKDGIVNWTRFGASYWHAVCYVSKKKWVEVLNPVTRDSYKGRPTNQYTYKDFKWLIKNSVVFGNCYFFRVKDKRTKYEKDFDLAVELWITNWKDKHRPVTREEVAVMFGRLAWLIKEDDLRPTK